MSATLDSAAVSAFLDDCPVVDVPGRSYPLDIGYAAGQSVADAVASLTATTTGGILCFLPGAFEIRRAIDEISARGGNQSADIVALYGSLDAAEQDAVLRPSKSPRRRIVVATNIAETSVTVPGIAAVVDSGLHKVARYDAERAIDSLEIERITADSADQRAGRAARLGPGSVRRLWDARDRLRPHREPEIHRVDLCATVLDIMAWGGNPRTFEWFERPRDEADRGRADPPGPAGRRRRRAVDGRRTPPSTHAVAPASGPHARRGRRRDLDGASVCAPLGAPRPGASREPGAGDYLGPPVRSRSMVERPASRSAGCARDRAARHECVPGEPFAVRGGLPPGRARRLSRSRCAASRAPVASCPPGVWRRRRRRA